MRNTSLAAVAAGVLFTAPAIAAEDASNNLIADHVRAQPVPQVMAFDLLDDRGLEVVQPGSVQAVINQGSALFAGGKLNGGVAMEVMPYALNLGSGLTLDQYNRDFWARAISWSSFSVATQQIGSDVRYASGWRVRLWDDTDWRYQTDVVKEALKPLTDATKALTPTVGRDLKPLPPAERVPIEASNATLIQTAQQEARSLLERKLKRNGSQGAFGIGYTGQATNADLNALVHDRLLVWGSLGSPLQGSDTLQWLVSPRLTHYFPTSPEYPGGQQVAGLGGRLSFINAFSRYGIDAGLGYGTGNGITGQLGLVSEVKPLGGQWLEVGLKLDFTGQAGSRIMWNIGLKQNQDTAPASSG